MTNKNNKNWKISCFKVLDVPWRVLEASPVAWTSSWWPRINKLQPWIPLVISHLCRLSIMFLIHDHPPHISTGTSFITMPEKKSRGEGR
jgi:hypothetical protein